MIRLTPVKCAVAGLGSSLFSSQSLLERGFAIGPAGLFVFGVALLVLSFYLQRKQMDLPLSQSSPFVIAGFLVVLALAFSLVVGKASAIFWVFASVMLAVAIIPICRNRLYAGKQKHARQPENV